MTKPLHRSPAAFSRRDLLKLGVAAPFALGTATHSTPSRAALKTTARIVIAGSGLGGIALANRLTQGLDGASITVIDGKLEHHYQPGYTLVASGIWPQRKVIDRNADYLPRSVNWVQAMVAEFDPERRTVVTTDGQRIPYDFLIVATGLELNYGAIDGMDVTAIGRQGLGSVYHGADAAHATWQAMDAFRSRGGQALMTLAAGPLKCAGAPLKMTYMLMDRLREAGTQGRSQVRFMSGLGPNTVFGVPVVNQRVLGMWDEMGVDLSFQQRLAAIDIGARRATFEQGDGSRTTQDYDFIHVVPPMRAPQAVRQSSLAWQDGPMAAGGWLEVDPLTLQHRRYPEVFGIGDVNGTPRGKTAATVKKAAPLVAQHVVQSIAGQALSEQFDGYTSCPLITRQGQAMLIEFDYEGRLVPSLPLIDPMKESYMAWLMKYSLLKPAYQAVLRGRV